MMVEVLLVLTREQGTMEGERFVSMKILLTLKTLNGNVILHGIHRQRTFHHLYQLITPMQTK